MLEQCILFTQLDVSNLPRVYTQLKQPLYQQPSLTFHTMSYVLYKIFLISVVMLSLTCRWFNQIEYLFKNYDYLNVQKMLFHKRNRLETRNYPILAILLGRVVSFSAACLQHTNSSFRVVDV